MSRGLSQGDPVFPFLFSIAVEGLARMVRQTLIGGLYNGFKLSNVVEYSLQQFANDTILFRDGSWSDLWALKALLRGYEMVSGLRINLSKIKIYGIGSSSLFLEAASLFLGCKIDKIPFKFLGFLVGGNQRNTIF